MSNPSPETLRPTAEKGNEIAEAAGKRAEHLRSIESNVEKDPNKQVEAAENARREAKEIFAAEPGKERRQGGEPTAPRAVHRVTKREKDAIYKQTMERVRGEMSAPARAFSKVIHARVIEKSSEVIGGTLARPNAILAGSTTAFILVVAVYILARTFGYRLSGFETIGAFLLGWVLGLVYDYLRVMTLGRRS